MFKNFGFMSGLAIGMAVGSVIALTAYEWLLDHDSPEDFNDGSSD